jgi:hypothetical protein
MKTLSRSCAVAGAAALLTAFAGTTAAYAASVTVPDQGTLLADGAGVKLSVTFDCDSGWNADVFVNAAQKVGSHHAATGIAFSPAVACADGEETVDLTVLASGNFAFTEGDAAVEVTVATCDPMTCELTTAVGEVRFEDD